MNRAEYSHYHGFQDYQDKVNEMIDNMANELFEQYLQDENEISDAIFNGLLNDDCFIERLIHNLDKNDPHDTGVLLHMKLIAYLADKADEDATDLI